ncbi:MAG: efflux RND transporter periplasmic adaptor subunit [candidate division WOR-3 bacterium]|nr:efflux RND transporter periplasmic adaptor subunit [candidate division WOR-3 bacterium]
MKNKKKFFVIIVIVVFIGIGLSLLRVRRNSNSERHFEFAQVKRGNLEKTVLGTGTLEPVAKVQVGTQVSGRIEKIFVDFNDKVKKGQVLAVLDTTSLAANLRDAKANLRRAKAEYDLSLLEYENNQKLHNKGLISDFEMNTSKVDKEKANASLLAAQSNLDRAGQNLRYAVVISPIDGTVINRSIEPGQTVAASFQTPNLFLIAKDLSQMEMHALVDESDIGEIKESQKVRFTVPTYPKETFSGFIREIRLQPTTVQNVVNYTVVVDVKNDKGLLLPGMTADVDFIVEQRENVLLIPNSAINFQPTPEMSAEFLKNMKKEMAALPDSIREKPKDLARLWYLDEKNNLSVMPIRTGATDGKQTEIKNPNIKEGMKFINGILKQVNSNTKQKTETFRGPPRRLF